MITAMKRKRRGWCQCCNRYHQAGRECWCLCTIEHSGSYPDQRALAIRKKYSET